MNTKQEEALREYLKEAIVPLIEQVLVKKLGQAMSYAATELVRPKREWVGLTEEEMTSLRQKSVMDGMRRIVSDFEYIRAIEAKLKEKNT